MGRPQRPPSKHPRLSRRAGRDRNRVLKQHPAVKDAAVVCENLRNSTEPQNRDGPNSIENPKSENLKSDRRLVAYVAADEESQSLADLLHSYLTTRLPNYMVPAHFVILQSLPLSPNGKVDYRALPPVRSSAGSGHDSAAQRDRSEDLGDFRRSARASRASASTKISFRIGGHSLLAARAAARIGDAFGRQPRPVRRF